jgi:cell division protein FtsI (penicillin-binding protein 3)
MGLRHTNRRLRASVAFVVLSFLMLSGRAFYLQVVQAAELRTAADLQHLREAKLPAGRGVIYDREGAELAVSKRMASVVANPKLVEDPAKAAKSLASKLTVPEDTLLAALTKDAGYSVLARIVDPSVAAAVLSLGLAGVEVRPTDKRVYPKGVLAPQLLGCVGANGKGLAGLELEYQAVLAGQPGERDYIGDRSGRSLDILKDEESTDGHSIKLTLDEDIQWQAEQVLSDVLTEFGAKKATAIVLDPRTGEVLAMANAPLFDANTYGNTDALLQRNMAVTDQYEPGSTFKVVTVAAALERGLVTPETRLKVERSIKVWDRVVEESHTEDLPAVRDLSVTQILALSSNVGTIKLGKKVGKLPLVDMIRRFGFTQKTDIDFPGEAAGSMPAPDKWSGSTIGNVPIGQGISASPLQMAAAYAAIANDGVYVQPFLVQNEHVKTPSRRVISSVVAGQLREMLKDTVSDGTGGAARVPGYVVAGKTGTAEKPKLAGRGYDTDRVVASFIGMVPADSPRLVILVMVDEPATQHFGALVAAPAFARIADFALKRLEIAPSGKPQ